jgi:hypothetical protein
MTAQALPRYRLRRKSRGPFPALLVFAVFAAAGIGFVSYLLWPTWPRTPVALDAPAIPVTVAGVLFNVPAAAIRAPIQRHAGAHERIDLAFLWPSLMGPGAELELVANEDGALPAANTTNRLFVTIAGLGAVLPPLDRLHTIYPRYSDALANPGPGGLAILPFRAGTPYEGEDLVYVADKPEQFFVRCTRAAAMVPGTCIDEIVVDAAEVTLRFPREWLRDWRAVADGVDRLMARLRARS